MRVPAVVNSSDDLCVLAPASCRGERASLAEPAAAMARRRRVPLASPLALLLLASCEPARACEPWCDGCRNKYWTDCCTGKNAAPCGDCAACPSPAPPPPRRIPYPPPPPPDPGAQYWTEGATLRTNAFDIAAHGPLRIKGVNWFGLESNPCYIGGGDFGPLGEYADFLRANGFNAVRVPLAVDNVLGTSVCSNDGVYSDHNPHLMGLSYVEQLAWFVTLLRDKGLLVMLDAHVFAAGVWPDQGTLGAQSLFELKAAWAVLAKRFCDAATFWNVVCAQIPTPRSTAPSGRGASAVPRTGAPHHTHARARL